MGSEWAEATLDTLVDDIIDRRGVTPLKLGADFTSEGHRVISAKTITESRIDLSADDERYVDAPTYRKWMKSPLAADDVLLTSEAPLGEVAYLRSDVDWCLGQRLFAIRTHKHRLSGRFLFFALRSNGVRNALLSRATGTTAQGIRQSELRKISLPVPPIPEQRAIAHILGTLDDKIELDRQMSATLEAMARALFESWFVRFDPVRAKAEGRDTGLPADIAALFPDSFEQSEIGEVPKGWCGSYGHIATERSERVGSAEVTVMSAVASSELVRSDDHFIKRVYSKDLSKYKRVQQWDFAYNPSRINIGSVGLHTDNCLGAVSPVYAVVTPRAGWHWYLKHHLKLAQTQERIMTLSSGSVRQSLNSCSFLSIPCPKPSDMVIEAFNALTTCYRSKIATVAGESESVTALRDTLLPKLISGDLRVPDAERFLADAGVS